MRKIIILVVLFTSFIYGANNKVLLPSRTISVVMPLLKQLKSGDALDKIRAILGKEDKDVGSGIYIMTYLLNDKTTIMVGSSDAKTILYIYCSGPGIKGRETIHKKHIKKKK